MCFNGHKHQCFSSDKSWPSYCCTFRDDQRSRAESGAAVRGESRGAVEVPPCTCMLSDRFTWSWCPGQTARHAQGSCVRVSVASMSGGTEKNTLFFLKKALADGATRRHTGPQRCAGECQTITFRTLTCTVSSSQVFSLP